MSPLETESPFPWTRGFLYSKTATLPRLVKLIQIPNWIWETLCAVTWAPVELWTELHIPFMLRAHLIQLNTVSRASQCQVNLITWAQYPGHPRATWISSLECSIQGIPMPSESHLLECSIQGIPVPSTYFATPHQSSSLFFAWSFPGTAELYWALTHIAEEFYILGWDWSKERHSLGTWGPLQQSCGTWSPQGRGIWLFQIDLKSRISPNCKGILLQSHKEKHRSNSARQLQKGAYPKPSKHTRWEVYCVTWWWGLCLTV